VIEPKENDVIAVWFSCGAASAVAAKRIVDRYDNLCDVRILNNPVVEEGDDNRRFLSDVSRWLGKEIEIVEHPDFPSHSAEEVWEKRRYMAGVNGAPCTNLLKKVARQIWQKNNHVDWHVLGFTADERKRHDRFVLTEISNVIPILIEENISKEDCYRVVSDAGIRLPEAYFQGYPNANCKGCVKATSPTYWNHVRKVDPEIFARRAEQSRDIGARLVRFKGERIFLDQLPETARGQSMKSMDIECGIFCEER